MEDDLIFDYMLGEWRVADTKTINTIEYRGGGSSGTGTSTGTGGAVDSVNGYTGVVVLAKADVGLGNIDNTSDADKPVSTAQQTVIDKKTIYEAVVATSGGDYTNIDTAVAAGKTKIFVRNGTYSITSQLNITSTTIIVGEDPENTIISLTGTGKITLTADYCTLANLKISSTLSTNALLEVVGNYITVSGVHITNSSSSSRILNVQGSYSNINNSYFECTGNATGSIFNWSNGISGTQSRITNNRFRVNSGNTGACIVVSHTNSTISHNTFDVSNGNSGAQTLLNVNATGITIVNNVFNSGQVSNQKAITTSTSSIGIIGNLFSGFATNLTDSATATVIVGNVGLADNLTTDTITDSTNKRYVTDAQLTALGSISGTNTGDQTSIVGISGTIAQFNTAVLDADLAITTAANTFTGDQTFSGMINSAELVTQALAPTGDMPIPAGYGATVPRKYTVASGKKLSIGLAGRLRII